MSMESRWMLKCFLTMYKDVVVGNLEHIWYFHCGRCLAPPYSLSIISLFLDIFDQTGLGHRVFG